MGQAGHEGNSPAELAAALGFREDYLRIWCETSYALGVLDDAGDGRFRLADSFELLLVSGAPPASMVAYFRFHEQFVRERLELATLIQTGEERPRSDATTDRERAHCFGSSLARAG